MSASPLVQTVQLQEPGKSATSRICSTQCTRTSSRVIPSAQWTSGSTTTMQSIASLRRHQQSSTMSTSRIHCTYVLRVVSAMSLILQVGRFSWICKLVSQMIAARHQATPAVLKEHITQLAQLTPRSVELARRRHPHQVPSLSRHYRFCLGL